MHVGKQVAKAIILLKLN